MKIDAEQQPGILTRTLFTPARRALRSRFGPSLLAIPDRPVTPPDFPDARPFGKLFVLMSPIGFLLADGWTLFIPPKRCYEGLDPWDCDGASIPRVLWSWLGVRPGGRVSLGAIWHNWLYYHCGHVQVKREVEGPAGYFLEWRRFTKTQCDVMFWDWMMWGGVEDHRSPRVFLGVYLFGQGAWNGHAKRIKEQAT